MGSLTNVSLVGAGSLHSVAVVVPLRLSFAVQPAGASAGAPFHSQPVVRVVDIGGNLYTGYNGPVTISIKTGTGAPGATLSGARTVTATGGVVAFSGLGIDRVGTGYVLTATGQELQQADSNPFNVALARVPGETVTSPSGSMDGTVYFGSTDGVLRGVSAANGAPVLTVDTKSLSPANVNRRLLGRPIRRPWLGAEKVFCVTDDGYVGCFGLDGATSFFEQIPLNLTAVSAVPMAQDDTLWVAVWDGEDTYLVKRDSEGVSETTNLGPTTGEPGVLSVFGTSLFLGTTNGAYRVAPDGTVTNTVASSASTGAPFVASTGTTAHPNPSPLAYVVTENGTVTCCSAINGTLQSGFGTAGVVDLGISVISGKKVSGSLFAYNGRIYIGGMDNKVYCLNAVTGSGAGPGGSMVFFDAGEGHSITGSVAIDPNGKGCLVFGSTNGMLYQVSLSDPADYKATDLASPIRTTPAVDRGTQTVAIGADDGSIYQVPSY